MGLPEIEWERDINPVDLLEQVASFNDWAFERTADEISNEEMRRLMAGGAEMGDLEKELAEI